MDKINDLKSLQMFVMDVGLLLVAYKVGAMPAKETLAGIMEKAVTLTNGGPSAPEADGSAPPNLSEPPSGGKADIVVDAVAVNATG